ncbi:hypothetical protein [Nitratireductor thuwali]|uniref:Uncharacterized protein n=1 Tax=Nitratireductor thuwali TaxID=2267699 RepID=A0ABY5MGF8_9HYPH|nr:hypothetical protein NTH_00934 [Nitratireductor thuwali]
MTRFTALLSTPLLIAALTGLPAMAEESGAKPAAEQSSGTEVDAGTTMATGVAEIDTVLTMIGEGMIEFSVVAGDAPVNVVALDEIVTGEDREELESAISDNQERIDELRAELAATDLDLAEDVIDSAIAAQREPDGALTIYTY